MHSNDAKKIVIVSDGTGKTAKRLMDAVLAQYEDQRINFIVEDIHQGVRSKQKANAIIKALDHNSLIIFSIISDDLRRHFHNKLHDRDILHLDVLEPMLKTMKRFLGVHPNFKPGLLQVIDDKYYSKIDSIGFTVEHDDGRGYQLPQADLVLLGVSRTCKTPISMYMACNHGFKAANIPIIHDLNYKANLIRKLEKIDRKKLFGLLMKPEVLSMVRLERSNVLATDYVGKSKFEKYYDMREIRDELRFSRELYEELNIDTIDVTRRAIEEIASDILRRMGLDSILNM
ncbi:MAG: pyruvate, phosphate dikinase/phosphoenolpyruvate synthase regulator [candidate division Zixibacteria bacterium]|nr:pyruvate, phosphate dikinase/phosphoenolpyruvate synthase regulator [candidate division Zixibacteria bacterium]